MAARRRLPVAGADGHRHRHLHGHPRHDDRQHRAAAHHHRLRLQRRAGPARPDRLHAGDGDDHAGRRPSSASGSAAKRVYLLRWRSSPPARCCAALAWSMPSLVMARVLQGLGGGMIQPLGMSDALPGDAARAARRGDEHLRHAGDARPDPRPDAGRLPGRVRRLALGLLPEPAGRRRWAWCWAAAAARDADDARRALRRGRVRAGGGLLGRRAARPHRRAGEGLVRPARSSALLRSPPSRLPLFIWWELRQEHPLLNLRLFAIPAFSIGAVAQLRHRRRALRRDLPAAALPAERARPGRDGDGPAALPRKRSPARCRSSSAAGSTTGSGRGRCGRRPDRAGAASPGS